MEKGKRYPIVLLKCLLSAVFITAAGVLLLALLVYRFRIPSGPVNILIIILYAVSGFAAGFLAGKGIRQQRFLWGLLSGSLYFVVLLLVSLAVNHGVKDLGNHFFTTLMICAGTGMLGGMLS